MRAIRIGTRGSKLALAQTGQIVDQLRALHAHLTFETVVIKTTGDAQADVPFASVGTKGMFVKEIEEALLSREIDLAVHSLKDMPGELTEGLGIAAVPERADARDALVSSGSALDALPAGARIGTGSPRRKAQLRSVRPDLVFTDLRGNLDTRMRKLDQGDYDAIVLACAGLERLGWAHRIVERIAVETCVPAPGQGALALEIRVQDDVTRALLDPLNHRDSAEAVAAERAFQAALGSGCSVPAGAYAVVAGNGLRLIAALAAADGTGLRRVELSGSRRQGAEIGARAAKLLRLPEGAGN